MMDDFPESKSWICHYETHFPILARYYLNDIFESWGVLFPQFDENHEAVVERILLELRSKADALPHTDENRIIRAQLRNFVDEYLQNPSGFIQLMNHYRRLERAELPNQIGLLTSFVKELRKRVSEANVKRDSLMDGVSYNYLNHGDVLQSIQNYKEIQELANDMDKICDFVKEAMEILLNYQLNESVNLLAYVKELRTSWRILFEIIETLDNLILTYEDMLPHIANDTSEMINRDGLNRAIESLISHSLVIMEFPSWKERALRAEKKKFPATLEILLPSITDKTEVESYLLSEDGYVRMKSSPNSEKPNDNDLATQVLYQPLCMVERDSTLQIFKAEFKELGFAQRISRKRPKSKPVMFVKQVYLFRAQLTWKNVTAWARCFSLPVVISSHTDQNVEGSAAIFWDNNFRVSSRIGLQTRDDVTWSELQLAIKRMIAKATGRSPTDSNMNFIRELFMGPRQAELKMEDNNSVYKQSDLFRMINGRQGPTFWEWITSTINLLTMKDKNLGQLNQLWRSGYIVGYIDKQAANDVIEGMRTVKSVGDEIHCFLFRFSKRVEKALVLQGYIETSKRDTPFGVYSVDPYTVENLRETSLADRIMKRRDCHSLIYEKAGSGWSTIRKTEVFQRFLDSKPAAVLPDGYVGRQMSESTTKSPFELTEERVIGLDFELEHFDDFIQDQ